MLKSALYWIVYRLSEIHNWILQLNNDFEYNFSDKDLHFLMIGLLGMALFLVIHPLFRYLARRGWEMVISWIYTMTLILVLTFGIEIGQGITKTGSMEFSDIVSGVAGFVTLFVGYVLILLLIRTTRFLFRVLKGRCSGRFQNK